MQSHPLPQKIWCSNTPPVKYHYAPKLLAMLPSHEKVKIQRLAKISNCQTKYMSPDRLAAVMIFSPRYLSISRSRWRELRY